MSATFDTEKMQIALSQGLVTGIFQPALHDHHETLNVSNALLEKRDNEYWLHGYEFLQVSPEIKAQGVRFHLNGEGAVTEAQVLLNDWFHNAEIEQLQRIIWEPEQLRVQILFNLSFEIGSKKYTLRDGRIDLSSSSLLLTDM